MVMVRVGQHRVFDGYVPTDATIILWLGGSHRKQKQQELREEQRQKAEERRPMTTKSDYNDYDYNKNRSGENGPREPPHRSTQKKSKELQQFLIILFILTN